MRDKMDLRVILVEPEYEQNIGYCARVIKNFGFSDLVIVNPKVKIGQEARMYSKHADDLLKSAKIVKTLGDALKGCSISIGTTAIHGGGREVLRIALTPKQVIKSLSGTDAKIALLIGREGTGLSKEELGTCDLVVRIPTSKDYGTLNISHALGILLYEFRSADSNDDVEYISERERKVIDDTSRQLVKSLKGIRGEKTTILSLKRIFTRGIRSSTEGKALINFLKKLDKAIRQRD